MWGSAQNGRNRTRFPKGPWQSYRGPSLGLQKVVAVIILANTCPVFYTTVPISNISPCRPCKHAQAGHIKGPDFFFFLRGLLGNRLTTSLGLRSCKVQSRFCHPWANSATVVTSSRGLKGHRLLIGLGRGKSAGGMKPWQPAFTHSESIKRIRSGLVNTSWILIWFGGFCPHVGRLGQLQILL